MRVCRVRVAILHVLRCRSEKRNTGRSSIFWGMDEELVRMIVEFADTRNVLVVEVRVRVHGQIG